MEKQNKTVEIVDYIMGVGKSTECFNWINSNPNEKYIYVSPNLTEVGSNGRIHKEILSTEFISPDIDEHDTKTDHLTKLLESGMNIACTHNLYLNMSKYHFDLVSKNNYIIVLDEEIEVIKSYGVYSTSDINYLIDKGDIEINNNDGAINWIGKHESVEDYEHKYFKLKNLCDKRALYLNKGLSAKKNILISHIPLELLYSAKRVIVITYMFKGSVLDCFLRLKCINTAPCKDIIPNKTRKPCDYKDLITLIPPNKKTINLKMSATWWKELTDNDKKSVNSISNLIMNTAKQYNINAKDLIYTCPKDNAQGINNTKSIKLNPKGYVKYIDDDVTKTTWLSVHTRATNDYSDKVMVAHCYNRFPLQPIKVYLQSYGFPIDEERYGVSSLLQFVWRSRIRNDQPIILLIANERMYRLFIEWMNGKFD